MFRYNTKCHVFFESSNLNNIELGNQWNGYNVDIIVTQIKLSVRLSVVDVEWHGYDKEKNVLTYIANGETVVLYL